MRDPETNPAPAGIEDRRLQIYRDLLYNNVEDFLASAYPVLNSIMPALEWHAMVREYFAQHEARTPLFPQMPREFLRYLEQHATLWAERYPFMLELAHYEWVEAGLYTDTREIDWQGLDPDGDLLDGVPILSPLALPLCYRYPVHKLSPEYQPLEAPEQATCIIVFRDRSDQVGFMEINAVSARLLVRIQEAQQQQEQSLTGREMLSGIALEIGHNNPELVISGGLGILKQLRERDIILGIRVI
jgi:hypothetical protein